MIREKMDALAGRLEELERQMSDPEVIRRQERYRALAREHAGLRDALARYGEYTRVERELEGSRRILDDPASDEELKAAYEQAHNLYLAFRHELAGRLGDSEEHIEGTSAGGMPVRVKCLHALLAQSLVMGPGVNPIGDLVLERVKDEFDPTVCRCTLDD